MTSQRSRSKGCGVHSDDLGGGRPKVLYVSSNHPAVRVGGLELYALDLYEAVRDQGEFEPVFLARTGPPYTSTTREQAGTPFKLVGDDPNQYLFYTDVRPDLSNYDALFGRSADKEALTRSYHDFLIGHRPDVVHIQHTLFLGYDIVRATRNALPDVPIVYSLHEYIPICHRDGQMVRTRNDELCQEESPRRCHECFPEITPQAFYMRKRFIQSHLSLVDCFIAPTDYVKARYVDWGIPATKIEVEPQGCPPVDPQPADLADDSSPTRAVRNRFAYIGQLNPYKGADLLLEAMDLLGDDFDGELTIFGANLEIQKPAWRERFRALLERERENVRFAGQYERHELPRLLSEIDWVVVPSIWWETGPLTVWEAFQNRRPVICSDIGGMSEKVTDGVNGLHFRTRDPRDLAETMRRAAETPGLWDELRAGIPDHPGHPMSEHVARLAGIYRGLLAERSRDGLPAATVREAQSA
jgi:glycosyltransferase involved in cell wall biosynthesis